MDVELHISFPPGLLTQEQQDDIFTEVVALLSTRLNELADAPPIQ